MKYDWMWMVLLDGDVIAIYGNSRAAKAHAERVGGTVYKSRR